MVRHPSSAYGGRGEKFDADRIACAAVRGERFAPSRGRAIAAKVTPAERSVGVERVAAIRRQLASVRVADARHCWRRQDGLRREGAARSVAARRSVAGVREGRRKGLAAAFLLRRAARRACARGGARPGDRRPTEERDDEEQHRCCEKLLLLLLAACFHVRRPAPGILPRYHGTRYQYRSSYGTYGTVP